MTCVGTGKGMIDALSIKNIDLVILDLGLPDEDGLSLTERVRQRSSIPIVIATARQDQDARLTALELGADDYLTKPYDPKELVLRVRNILGRVIAESPDNEHPDEHKSVADTQMPRPAKRIIVGGIILAAAIVIAVIIDRQQMKYGERVFGSIFGAGETAKIEPNVLGLSSRGQIKKDVTDASNRKKAPPPQKFVAEPKADQRPAEPGGSGQSPDSKPSVGKSTSATEQSSITPVTPVKPKHFSEVLGYGWILKSRCEPGPQVEWWVNNTNMEIAGYVQRIYRGSWKKYRAFWDKRLANLQSIHHGAQKAILPNGASISGKQLEEYVKKMEKRIAVIYCLSNEAAAAK